MAESSITKGAVLKIFRQLKPDATTAEQDGLWGYVMTKASSQARGNIAKAVSAGGDRARSSVAQAVKEWRGMVFLQAMDSRPSAGGGKGGKKQQPQQGQHRQQGLQQEQVQPPHQRQQRQQGSATGKGRGASPTAGTRAHDADGRASGRPPAAAKGSQKRGAPRRTPWAELYVGAETPLLLPSGEVAAKCELSASDSQDKFDKAMGYIMASGQAALGCACKAARRKTNNSPLVIVHQPASDYEKGMLTDALREYETTINDENSADDEFFEPISITIQEATIVVREHGNATPESRKVILIHFDDSNTLYLTDQRGADVLQLDIAPELECPEEVDDDVAITIVRPLCEAAGLKEWSDEFFSLTSRDDQIKAVRKLVGSGKANPNMRIRIVADRSIKLHGKHHDEGKVRAIASVPKGQVNDLMSRSGEFGVLFEYAERNLNDAWRKINLPLEWDANDVVKAIAELEPAVRAKVKGFVPSTKGFAARVLPEDEHAVTSTLLPELAEQLGASLGLQPNSSWIVRNLPKRITKQGIIQLLASGAGRWQPWQVLPRFTLPDRGARGSSWVVDAEMPPSVRVFKARDAYVTIERYVDERRLSPAMRAWAKPVSQWEKRAAGTATGPSTRKPWADTFDSDDMEDDAMAVNNESVRGGDDGARDGGAARWNRPAAGQAHGPPTLAQRTTPEGGGAFPGSRPRGFTLGDAVGMARRPSTYNMTDSSGNETAVQGRTKRRFGETRAARCPSASLRDSGRAETVDSEKEALMAALAAKDAQIASLQESIQGMQRTLEAMTAALAASGAISSEAAAAAMISIPQVPAHQVRHPSQQTLQGQSQQQDHGHEAATMWANRLADNEEEDEAMTTQADETL